MSPAQCEQLHAFADGELPAPEATAFRDHLAGCATCARNLHELLQLDVALQAAAEQQALPRVRPLRRAWARPQRASLALAAALALVLGAGLLWRARPEAQPPVLLALAPTRSLEGRLTHGAAAAFRPYGVSRAAATGPAEQLSLETLAQLERQGDAHGLGAAHLLAGELPRAQAALERAPASLDVDSDRALLALERAQPAEALRLLDGVLARAPRHPQALFNRGLTLERLGLPLAAAEAYRAVEALGEPGWAAEARERAQALEARTRTLRGGWHEVRERGARMVQGGPVLPLELARGYPGLARLYLYDAVRTATAPAALQALAPLARELDRGAAGPVLAPLLARLGAQDLRSRAALAKDYAALAAGAPGADGVALVARARAAGQADVELGALLFSGQARVQLPRLAALATRLQDPWFTALAALQQGQAQVQAGALLEAVHVLDGGLGACLAARVPYRCAQLRLELVGALTALHRIEEARAHAEAGLALARAGGDWGLTQQLLMRSAELEVFAGRYPLARAQLREAALGEPADCGTQDFVRGLRTSMALLELDAGAAAREHAQSPQCPAEVSLAEAAVLADLARRSGAPEYREALARALEALRAEPEAAAAQQALVDHLEGRALLERERGAGRALLERAARTAQPLVHEDVRAAKAHAYSQSLLAVDAARAGEPERALAAVAAGLGVALPERCVLGVAVDDERLAVVVRDAAGRAQAQLRSRDAQGPPPETLVPAALRRALAGCSTVQVLAQPPVQGRAGLLPSDVAWSYRLSKAPPTPQPGPARRLVVSAVEAPASLGLPALGGWRTDGAAADVLLSGAAATPSRVLAELASASVAELHVHGLADLEDAAALVLAPEPGGRFALGAPQVRSVRLRHAPLVILAACHAARTQPWQHQGWSLPAAFLEAGARAVLASTSEVPDAEAPRFFAGVRRRVEDGALPAQALRDEREAWLARGGQAWVNDVLLFE